MKRQLIIIAVLLMVAAGLAQAQQKYAVLITGNPEWDSNIPREHLWNRDQVHPDEYNEFWDDTFLMWQMLKSKGFDAENIFVLFYDGADRHPDNPRYDPGANVTVTNDVASLAKVQALFNDLRYGTHGRPQITENDFLFVWLLGHGGVDSEGRALLHLINDDIITDVDFAALVNPIPAHRKAFWMQQCYGGGFADNLSSINTVFVSASQADQFAFCADNITPSNDPVIENETYQSITYNHGEFDFHMISVVNQESPTHVTYYGSSDDPYSNGDTNSDGFISMSEAYQWDYDHDSRRTELYNYSFIENEDPVYDDSGAIGANMSFDYPTLLFSNVSNNEVHRGAIGISKDLVVASGQTLTFTGSSKVTLCGSAKIVVEEGALLVIDGTVVFQGMNNNMMELHGSIVQNAGSSLYFSNMQVVSDASELSIIGATFENTELKYSPSGSSSASGSPALTGNITVRNCQFNNPLKSQAIHVESSRGFDIFGNTISGCLGDGITIKNCGNVSSDNSLTRSVRHNDISLCHSSGLVFYASTGSILMNKIHGNGVGVKLLNKSNVILFRGNCAALSETDTQYIYDNSSYEIYMTTSCNPQNMRYNSIHKGNAGSTPFVYYDNTVVFPGQTQNERNSVDIRMNEWGAGFNPSTHLFSTTPLVDFVYYPYWEFGDCSDWQHPGQELLSHADSLSGAGAYEEARSVYHRVIEEFPNTVYAESAMKTLLPLEAFAGGGYVALKQYYLTDTLVNSCGFLSSLANHLANRCDEILAHYDEAIAWYEDIITDPETSYADSIFATIDLGNLYLEMEKSGAKAVGKLPQFKPDSKAAFDVQCEYALSQLPMCKEAGMSPMTQREDPRPYWVDTIVSQPEGYLTDADGNVEISSSDGLVWLVSVVNGLNGCEPDDFRGRTVKLTDDIEFGEDGWDLCFSPIGTRETPFAGTFDGGGHTIHHLLQYYSIYDGVNNYYFDMGIFGYIRNAVVKDLALDSTCSIISNCNYPGYYRGGVVGYADSLSVVDNIYVYSPRGFVSHTYGSGIVGMNRNSTVRNCALKGRTAAPEDGAALVAYNRSEGGYADAVVENCYFHGQPGFSFSTWYVGGLVCFNQTASDNNGKQAVIRNCHSTPTNDFQGYSAHGAFAAVLSEGSLIDHCYYDPRMYQHPRMVGLNQGGELLYCSEYANVEGAGTLALPVSVNGMLTDNLLDALNLWIEEQDRPELYRTWVMLTDSVPVFGGYHVGVHESGTGTESITVHPNPTDGIVTVTGRSLVQAEVFNAFGQRVLTVTDEGETLSLNLGGLPAGVYFVNVTDGEGRKRVMKVVKE